MQTAALSVSRHIWHDVEQDKKRELANGMADYVIRNTKRLKVGQQAHMEVSVESRNVMHR